MIHNPRFSILVANYNNGQYLQECLDSIFRQTCQYWEVVIVDDASTDNSKDIYLKFREDPRIRIFYNSKNKGCGFTKRKCIENAIGEICAFVDPDDTIPPDAIEIMTKAHNENKEVSVVYSTHYYCNQFLEPQTVADHVGQVEQGCFSWMKKRPIISHFATFKRDKYLKTAGIEPWLQRAVDKDLYYKLEETGPVLFINKPLYYYRNHPKSISLNINASIAYQNHMAVKALLVLRSGEREKTLGFMPHSKTDLARGLIVTGLDLLKKDYPGGTRLLYKAIRYFPRHCIQAMFDIANRYVRRIAYNILKSSH